MCTRVLVLLALQAGFAYCFEWDIVVGETKRLLFYNNGILTHTEEIPSAAQIFSVTYDPVHFRVLFADNHSGIQNISSYDLSTRNIQHLVTRKSRAYFSIAYDPVTQLLFWHEDQYSIYSFSLNPASSIYKTVNGNLLVTTNNICQDIAVDSCGGYIYWIAGDEIARARFDGSEKEVLLSSTGYYRNSLVIDQQTQKMYWNERVKKSYGYQVSIESADVSGKNRITLYTVKNDEDTSSLSVSKEFIYWYDSMQTAICKMPKNHSQQLDTQIICNTDNFYSISHSIAANYTIKEQIKGNLNCKALKSLTSNEPERDCIDVKLLCIHGTKVSGESRCECTQGYIGERCDISICQNYCLQGNCSVSAEGLPKCSCTDGYSGERCEVNECHKHCLNNGICSLNEEDEPICECTADYEGERCEVSTTHTGVHTDNTTQHVLQDLRRRVRQVIKEELERAQQFFSNKIDEYEVNI